jgi:hypothetical protein
MAWIVDFWHPWDEYKDKTLKMRPGPIRIDDLSRKKLYASLGFQQTHVTRVVDLPFLK